LDVDAVVAAVSGALATGLPREQRAPVAPSAVCILPRDELRGEIRLKLDPLARIEVPLLGDRAVGVKSSGSWTEDRSLR